MVSCLAAVVVQSTVASRVDRNLRLEGVVTHWWKIAPTNGYWNKQKRETNEQVQTSRPRSQTSLLLSLFPFSVTLSEGASV